jgi:hypothetical protein
MKNLDIKKEIKIKEEIFKGELVEGENERMGNI